MCVLYSLHPKSKYKLIATKFLLKKINEQLFTQFQPLMTSGTPGSPVLLYSETTNPYRKTVRS
jgi:hypothetical protein